MEKFPISEKIREFASVFENKGYSLYVVGGAVRDFLLNIENHDYDFTTDALPEDVISMFKSVIPTGIKHGTVTVLFKGESFEVTTFRTESKYSDRRHPDSVSYVTNLAEDLSRRDFTVNAFAANCSNGEIIDLFNGIKDLDNKKIKAIGNPRERFSEDALRLLRMCRFASKLNFVIDDETLNCAGTLAQTIDYVSEERIFDEMTKLLMTGNPKIGLELLKTTNLLHYILPELDKCAETIQKKEGSSNVFEHIVNAVQEAANRNYSMEVRWALLLHDCGKPECLIEKDNHIHFYNHENVGAQIAKKVMARLKFSNQLSEDVFTLVQNHMVKYTSSWSDGAVKRFINRVGQERIKMLFNLQWCDQVASEGYSKEKEYEEFNNRIDKCLNEPLKIKDLDVNGQDLKDAGIPTDNTMGQILAYLLEEVLDNPQLNRRDLLVEKALLLFNTKFKKS